MLRIKLFFASIWDKLSTLYMGKEDDYPPIAVPVKGEIPPPDVVPMEAQAPVEVEEPKKAPKKTTKKSTKKKKE